MFLREVRVLLAVVALGAAIGMSATLDGQTGASSSKSETEWRFFGGDAGATRYSSANQINAANVRDLRVAWRWSARNFGPRPANQMQVSPLIVDGVMYTTAGVNRDVVALDAATGQMLWHWRPTGELLRWFDIIDSLARSSGRGVSYWTDGAGDERIFVVMNSYMLVALDAKTGRQVPSFGKDGVVDLAANLRWNERPGLPREGRVSNTSPVAIVGNVLVAPISMHTGSTPNLPGASINEQWPMNIPGDVIGYDTRTGKMLWRFNVIPRPGEEGAETWLKADPKVWEVPGGLNAWAKERPELRERVEPVHRQRGLLGPRHRGSRVGPVLHPDGIGDERLLRRVSSREQPLRELGGCARCEDGKARLALPVDAPRHLGLRPADRADPRGHHRGGPSSQGRRPAHQAGIRLRPGPRDGQAGVAHRGAAGAEVRCARRVDVAHAAVSHQAGRRRVAGGDRERPRGFHARRSRPRRIRVASQYRLAGLYTPSSLPKTADGKLGTLTCAFRGGRCQLAGRRGRSCRRRALCHESEHVVPPDRGRRVAEYGRAVSRHARPGCGPGADGVRPSAPQASLRACRGGRFEDG